MKNKPSVVIMGMGYIGLPTAALIASRGLRVTGVDIRPEVVETINKGEIHIVEPDLDGLVHHVVKEGNLRATTQPETADVYLIAVPTPFKEGHVPDLGYIQAAVESLTPTLEPGALVILESTSPVGTTRIIQKQIYQQRPELENKIHIAYCPERVLPGSILHELKHNDRAIGGLDETATAKATSFYKHFVKGDLYPTNARTAEMVKLVENASRDNQIAFANELSMICAQADIDVWEMIALANKHPRVNILKPGTGVGGHCIAVDPWFIVSEFPEASKLIRTSREVNTYKTLWVVERIKNEILKFENTVGRSPTLACMGLAFKPDIDDLRESPALQVTIQLEALGHRVLRVEPNIEDGPEHKLTEMTMAVEQADLLVFLVAHKEFKGLQLGETPYLDFCNALG